ncbi:ABC transporter ATP-binding protein [Saccharomonospora sp. NPDC046836]|uniref:ABC transporter ATP-binding protein n=1 Tax=Saccharomonospora sp. NPDC046836 TaxID=3156921 RepID=UPI0033FA1A12
MNSALGDNTDSTGRLRMLWEFTRPHRAALATGLVLALAGSAMGLATPMVTKWVLDTLSTSGSLAAPVATLGVLLVVGALVGWWQWTILGSVGERVVLDVRQSMVRRLLRATVPALGRRPSGEFVTRVTSDTLLLREAASSSVVGLVNGAVMLLGSLVLMGVLDLVLLGTTVASVAVVAVIFAVLMPAIAKAHEQSQDHLGRLGGTLEGALKAIRTIKASRAEDWQAERVLADAGAAANHSIRALRREATGWTVAWSGIQLAIILILAIGAWRVNAGTLEVSSLIAFLLYAFGLLGPITELSQNTTALQSGIAAAGRIRQVDVLDVEPSATPGADLPRPNGQDTEAVLEVRDVVAAYGPDAEPAVHGVSLAIPRRGHTAIVGPSGAGKTTLFSLILRFLEPRAGSLLLDGRPYRDYSHAQLRSRLAYVEQETPIVPGTIRDNLLLSDPGATDAELREALREVRLLDKVDSLEQGLDTPLASTAVSGGERQRLALARAILRTPEVLLLDEATAQVDAITEAAIHDCIRTRARAGAVVTIAHRLSTVLDADSIIVLEGGRVRATGDHHQLLATDDLYRQLVKALRISDVAQPHEPSLPA